MARAFRRSGRGTARRYAATLDADERDVLAHLMTQVAVLLEPPERTSTGDERFDAVVAGISLADPGAAEPEPTPGGARDPALDRLLPSAHLGDDETAAEFRRLTEGGLRHRKAEALVASAGALGGGEDAVSLDATQAKHFLTALTDVRLVLGERLGLRQDEDVERLEARSAGLEDDDPLVHLLALYDFTTWLQETLTSALLGR